jgi:nucleolar protein 16
VDATLTRNYAASGLASDANVAGRGGRNAMDDPGASVREAVATLATSNGDETRALLGETKTSGFSAPKRLTPKQTRVVEALVKAHGDDLSAMVMDRKRNAMQHSSGTLLKMTESYHYWREEAASAGTTRVDFRAPKKSKLRGRV